ncbi:MAG: Zn-dependent protease [Ferruginibacter sp.]|nr:Zn-dependent protease [Ferruginibacter sp.]
MKFFIPISFALFVIMVLCTGCKSKAFPTPMANKKPLIIDIRPFNDMPSPDQQALFGSLKKIYPHVVLKPAVALPASAYFPARNRYRADSLISFLRKITTEGHISIGITTKDISTTKGKYADWGIMGLGYSPGLSCVASSYRLADNKKTTQLYKVAIHELGHTQGLPHCPDKGCFMRDAEGKNVLDEESYFCSSCKKVLHAKGFPF